MAASGLIIQVALLVTFATRSAAQCTVTTLAGGSTTGNTSGFNDGVGTAALFSSPRGVAVDASGTVFVGDYWNNKVRAITPNGTVTTVAGGSATGTLSGSINGFGTAALFNLPFGVAVDALGSVFVAVSNLHTIRAISPNGTVTTLAGFSSAAGGSINGVGSAARFDIPTGVAVDASRTVFVADSNNHKIRAITPNGTVTTFAGGSTSGTLSGSNNGVGSAALFNYPHGVAVDASGTVFVADRGNNKIRAISLNGTVITVAGGSTTGTAVGFIDGVGSAALFNLPRIVAVAASGTVFVGDVINHRIRAILLNGTVTTLAGGATTGNSSGSDNGVGTAALFLNPSGVAVDASGTVFVADANNKIRAIYACPPGFFCPSGPCTTPQLCPAGHFCPAGSTTWNDKNCGRGNYCPWGSTAPTSCGPRGAVDPVLGPANGPAFDSDVAVCRNHCYFGAPGQLSTCA